MTSDPEPPDDDPVDADDGDTDGSGPPADAADGDATESAAGDERPADTDEETVTDSDDVDETVTDETDVDETGAGTDSPETDGDGDGDGDTDDAPDRTADEYEPAEPTGIDGEPVSTPGDDGESVTVTPESAQPVPEPTAGERTDDVAANGDGAMTAAQKGMAAVNDGVGALGGEGAGPDSDQEMPLTEHIEEMMRRLGVVFGVAGVVVVAVLLIGTVSPAVPSAEEIIRFLWDAHVGFEDNRPRVYGPLEFLLTKLKVASLAGLLVGLPVFVYETYRFMKPGLYPHERRYYLAAVPTSLVLGLVGVAFAHFIVLPVIFDYFISYTEESAVLAFSLRETFNLILLLMGYMAVVFQIPLFIQLAIMMGLVTREWMEDRRLLFWSAFVGLAFIVSPDPTGMAPIIVGATMIVLFEGTLALLRWTGN
ncbi:twin-arginine translocase subunit TatC [Halobaculum lipolyticum]|uniref:Sec-independent protein translocase protein TatC n=1 Tax=Halobaculum lipolyticum TaxID=3032001 RepID=A0ABD5WHU5_9EURY|nr:twin-arginine translocase subunit TatC [Halobaculum sp. DT31]